MSRSPRSLLLLGLTAAVVMGSYASSQSAEPSQGDGSNPSASALLKVPVGKLLPGNVNLTPKVNDPVKNDAAAAERGRNYFINFNCIGCHADNGGGAIGPALSNRDFIYGGEPQNIYLTITQGRPNGMPAWGAVLPQNVIWDLVAYVRSISRAPHPEWGKTTSLDTLKTEQVPAEFKATPDPWKYTEPFTDGQPPQGD